MNWLWYLVILLALAGLGMLSWSVRALDAPGAVAAFLMGLVIVGMSHMGWLILLASFTVVSVAVTRIGLRTKQRRHAAEERGGERGIRNVLANGLPAMITVLFIPWVGEAAVALAFSTAVAAVTADTMASEIGSLAPRARRIVGPFDVTQPGENGGVSWLGQFAALAGAAAIGLLAIPLAGVPWELAWVPAFAGFLGCQLDSVLGATLEGDAIRPGPLTKEDVNFLSSLAPAAVVLIGFAIA